MVDQSKGDAPGLCFCFPFCYYYYYLLTAFHSLHGVTGVGWAGLTAFPKEKHWEEEVELQALHYRHFIVLFFLFVLFHSISPAFSAQFQ